MECICVAQNKVHRWRVVHAVTKHQIPRKPGYSLRTRTNDGYWASHSARSQASKSGSSRTSRGTRSGPYKGNINRTRKWRYLEPVRGSVHNWPQQYVYLIFRYVHRRSWRMRTDSAVTVRPRNYFTQSYQPKIPSILNRCLIYQQQLHINSLTVGRVQECSLSPKTVEPFAQLLTDMTFLFKHVFYRW